MSAPAAFAAGMSLVGSDETPSSGPTEAQKPAKKPREKKPKPEGAPPVTEGSRVLPAPKPPTDVQVDKAEAAVEAARALGGRDVIAIEFRQTFEAEEQALASIPGFPETEEEEKALADALSRHEALLLEHDRKLAEKLQAFVVDTAMVGHALEEMKHWDAEAGRINRLYEAYAAKAKQRAARVEKALWPWIKAHCEATPLKEGRKTWSFPTTQWTVVNATDHKGTLAVEDDKAAASALQKILGPEDAAKAIRVEWKVYVKESRALLEKVVLPDGKKLDLSRVNGFSWTPPGASALTIRKGG